MKLYRFTAANTQKAMITAHDTLGPDALIYSTRKVSDGVEVLAGFSFPTEDQLIAEKFSEKNNDKNKKKMVRHAEVNIQDSPLSFKIIEDLKFQVKTMNENMQNLSQHINTLQAVVSENFPTKRSNILLTLKNMLPKRSLKNFLYKSPTVTFIK